MGLNVTLDQIDLIHTYGIFHPKTEEYTFFSSAHGTFSRIDHVLGHKTTLSKFKNSEFISSIFSNHSVVETRDQLQEKNWKKHKYMETNIKLPVDQRGNRNKK